MKQGDHFELEIPSSAEYVAIVRHAVEGIARRLHFADPEIDDLNLAVGEACANAVKYCCSPDESDNVHVRCVILDDGLMVEIRNNILCSEHPHIPSRLNDKQEHGRGLYMISRLVDEFQILWDSEYATVRMYKRLAKTAESSKHR